MPQPTEVVNPVEANPTTGVRIPAFLKSVAPEGHVQWAQTHLIQLFGTFPDSSAATGDGKHGTSAKPMAPTRQRSHPPLRRLSCPNQNRDRPLPAKLQNVFRTTSEQNLRIIHEHLATYNSLPIAGKSKMAVDLALEIMERLHAENLSPNYDQLFPEVGQARIRSSASTLLFSEMTADGTLRDAEGNLRGNGAVNGSWNHTHGRAGNERFGGADPDCSESRIVGHYVSTRTHAPPYRGAHLVYWPYRGGNSSNSTTEESSSPFSSSTK